MAATLTTCSQCVTYNEQLNSKANEIKSLQENVLKLAHKLQDESRRKEEVQERLNDKLIRLNDYAIKIRSLEEQLQSATDRRPINELSRAEVDSIIGRDLERIHSQLTEKDMKIMALNDTILEKEGQIIELQEMCREQGEVVRAKAKAFQIIQQKLLDFGTRTTREDSTETEAAYVFESSFTSLSSSQQLLKEQHHDSFSPGHAVIHFKTGSSASPPPIDPSEECSSVTHDNGNIQDDLDTDDIGCASALYKKKHRKKVTFDLSPPKEFRSGIGQEESDITQAFIDVTVENDQLRQTIQEMEKCASDSQNDLSQLQAQLDEMRRDSRNQVLKARASMQGKIRDLEDKISTINAENANKVEYLNASIEALRADREWTLKENAHLLKLLGSYKQKLSDAWETLDAGQEVSKKLRSKLNDDRALIVQLADDLEEAQQTANILLEQKISVLDDVERLKEALEAQDQYIELLEKDTMIYEEHVGLLRDSLGASKAERKALIKSKAYEAKLKAIEQEKEQMNRRSNGKKLHIKALSLKINSLEAEKALLITRNDELESRLIQLGQNLSIASVIASSATVTPCTVESVSNLVSSGSAFKPVHTQTMMQRLNNGRQSAAEALRWPVLENVAAAYGHQYNENLVNNMQIELDIAREECSLVQEKIVKMGCINSELEHQLINVKEGLEKAEMRARQAEEQVGEFCRNCSQQEEYQKSLQSEFLVKYSAIEREVNDLKEELALRNEQLNARMIENNKRNEEMKQWRFAMDEMETVHMEIKMLEKQLNDEKASMESKWAEVRTILLERKGDISRKTSDAESIADGEQSSINQLKQMMDTINDLKNTVDKQAKQLERNKTEKQKFKAVIRQLQADKKALVASSAMKNDEEQYLVHEAQITGLQKQLDFMDREMTLLFTLNNSKDVLIQTLRAELEGIYSTEPKLSDLRPKNDRKEDDCIEHLQAQVKNTNQEESGRLNLLTKSNAELQRLQVHTQQLQVGYDRLQLQLQLSPEGNLDAMSSNRGTYQRAQLQQAQQQMEFNSNEVVDLSMAAKLAHGEANKDIEMRTQMERLTEAVQQKDTELQKMLNENEALKIKCIESTAALDLLSSKLERRSQEKDAIIEMLQSQHTYLTQTILLNQKSEEQLTTPLTLSQSIKTDTELKCIMQDASTIMEEAESRPFLFMQHRETQTRSDFHFSETPETSHESTSRCIEKSDQIRDNLTDDIRQLMILNAELETAVEVLKGEIWTLNEQLKRSLIDREDLSEKLCKLSQRHEEEIERARERERDLEEQKDVAERSQRQAALAENESNRRLVEWQEKSAQMENSRIELENAYAKLSEYYQQLQHAYNALYARSNACKVDSNTQTTVDSNTFKISEKFAETIEYWKSELKQREAELKGQAVQLKHVQDLLRNHLHIILKNVRDLREMSLKLIKNIIMESVQTTRAQLHEALKEVLSYVEEVIVKLCKEKELKDAEITVALQHLMNDTLTENILQTRNSSLSMVVDAINKKFTEMKSENTTLGNDLWNERSDKEALEMNAQQSISEKNGLESKIKELEDLLQITQFSLAEHVIKCQQLQAELDVLGSATSSPTAVKCGSSSSDPWNCSTPCTICRELRQTEQSAPTPQLQLAILAARLTTKIADNDALFRCNAELTQTNLRLQNEVSELKEQMTKHITSSSNTLISAISQQSLLQQQYIPKQFSNQSSEQKVMHREEKEWTWEAEDLGAELVSNSGYQVTPYKPLLNQQITKLTMTNEIQVLGLTELTSQEEDKESLKREFNVTREYSVEVEERNKAGRLGNCSEITEDYCLEYENKVEQLKDCGIETEQHGDARHQQKLEVSGTNTIDELLSLKSYNVQLAGFVESEKQELKELGKGLQDTGTRLGNEGIQCELFWAGFTEGLEEQKEVAKGKLKENEHEAKEKDWISGGTPEQQFQTLLFKQDIPPDGVVEGNRIQMLQKLEQHQGREIEMQELENRSLNLQLRSQQQVIEELGKKLNVAQEYNVVLEEKTLSMEQKIIDLKKMYEELLVEKGRLAEEVKNEIKTKLHEEITLLKKENESLVVELAKKRASHNEEKRSMKAELANREIILKELKTEMEHTQGESVDMQRQLDSYNAQMENESNQDLHQQLVEAQRKVVELESRLNEVVEQNRLLKNSEQKLMDALMVSNKSGPNLQISLLKKAKITKNRGRVRKPMMHDGNTMVEVHGKVGTSSTTMQLLDNPVITNDYLPVQKKVDDPKGKFDETLHGNALLEEAAQEMQSEISTLVKPFEPTLQRTTHYFHEMNVDKLRRRKGGGFQGAEKT